MKPIHVVTCLGLLSTLFASPSPAQTSALAGLARIDPSGALLPQGARRRLGDSRRHLSINAIAVSPDGRLAALAHTDAVICIWDLSTGREVRVLKGHRAPVNAVVFSPDGKSVASASDDGTVRIWDPRNGDENYRFWPHGKPVATVAYAPDGATLASGGWDSKVLIWEPGSGVIRREFKVNGHVNAVAFSPDGQIIAVGADDSAAQRPGRTWAVGTGAPLFSFGAGHTTISAVTFSPDGRMLAATNEGGSIALVEVASGRRFYGFMQSGLGRSLAFAPDGRTLASAAVGGIETGPRLWDLARGQQLRQFPGAASSTLAVGFTPDGKTLLSAGRDAVAFLWPVNREEIPRAPLVGPELDRLWRTLADPDPAKAYPALWQMLGSPETAGTFLQRNLRPARLSAECQHLITSLDSPIFKERESAMAQLERQPGAVPELRLALTSRPSPEARRRVELLLRKLDPVEASPEWLRTLRALQVLEYIDSREARAHLLTLAGGVPGARLTREALAVLRRMDAHSKSHGGGTP